MQVKKNERIIYKTSMCFFKFLVDYFVGFFQEHSRAPNSLHNTFYKLFGAVMTVDTLTL